MYCVILQVKSILLFIVRHHINTTQRTPVDTLLFIVIALIALAVIGLMVGVANDAVNFLNSAIGSNAAPRFVILILASAGILFGVTLSSGMMEVARKGIFDPSFFTLNEIMVVFLAVMLSNVLLLDFFNTFGMPTSTTVSIVFGLFGSALAVAGLSAMDSGAGFFSGFEAINAPSVIKIMIGIILSVVIGFIVGSLVQYLTRMLFTFDYVRRMKRYGAIYGAVALTVLLFFILLKGSKGASFLTSDVSTWINDNTWAIALISFVFWTIILQLFLMFTKVNIFKPIVLVGTFSLAMAFAANDLVNFIGAPLAGLNAYTLSIGGPDPLNQSMNILNQKIQVNTWYLLISGAIMVVTLWLNKKSRSVTKTELSLGRQDEGFERFESNAPARGIVRAVLVVFNAVSSVTPESVKSKISTRFDRTKIILERNAAGELPMFDMIRASVNLMVAAILISIGTSLKLPLSTTYVTFIVAMATALPDRAWGRESAVFRVAGVLTVIGGWFLTAFFAAATSAIIAAMIYYGGVVAIVLLLLLAAYLLYRTSGFHKRRAKEMEEDERDSHPAVTTPEEAKNQLLADVSSFILSAGEAVKLNTDGLFNEDRNAIKNAKKIAKTMNKQSKKMTTSIILTSKFDEDEDSEFDQIYANAIGALQRLSATVKNLSYQSFTHVDNNHNMFNDVQTEELQELDDKLQSFLLNLRQIFDGNSEVTLDSIHEQASAVKEMIRKCDKNQLKRTKKEKYPSRTSLLFFEILSDSNAIVDNLLILLHVAESFKLKEENDKSA
jgi:phosphate/sulfate permease